jgi:hypothetical protein
MRAKFLILLLLSKICSSTFVNAQLAPTEDSLRKNFKAIVVDDRTELEVSADKFIEKRYFEIKVNEKAGEPFANFVGYYDALSEFVNLKATLVDSLGKVVRKFEYKDFIDISALGTSAAFYSDARYKTFDIKNKTYPYTIIYEYEKKYKTLFLLPTWSPAIHEDVFVSNTSLSLIAAPALEVKSKAYNFKEKDNLIMTKSSDGRERRTWTFNNISTKKREVYAPLAAVTYPFVSIVPTEFSLGKKVGSAASWNSFGKFFYELNDPDANLEMETIEKLRELTRHCKTEREKVAVLYDYLQKNTRYLLNSKGILGWKTIPATEVEKTGYGDCKGLSNLMRAYLKAVDITSYLTLVAAGEKNLTNVDAAFPQNIFNHVILFVPLKEDSIWLECTSNTAAFGFLGDFTQDRSVLLLTPEGGKVARTPHYDDKDDLKKVKVAISIPENLESQSLVWNAAYTGPMQDLMGEELKKLSKSDSAAYFMFKVPFKNITINDIKIERSFNERKLPVINEHLQFQRIEGLQSSAKRLVLDLPLIPIFMPNIISEDSLRVNDIYFHDDYTYEFEYTMDVSKAYALENKLKPVSIETKFGKYNFSPKMDGENVTIQVYFHLNKGTYPANDYKEYVRFYNEVQRNNKKVVLSYLKV